MKPPNIANKANAEVLDIDLDIFNCFVHAAFEGPQSGPSGENLPHGRVDSAQRILRTLRSRDFQILDGRGWIHHRRCLPRSEADQSPVAGNLDRCGAC